MVQRIHAAFSSRRDTNVYQTALPQPQTHTLLARQSEGPYTTAGVGAKKQALLNTGADVFDLAVAFLERYVDQIPPFR